MSSLRLLCREYTVGARMEVGKRARAHGLSPLSLQLESPQVGRPCDTLEGSQDLVREVPAFESRVFRLTSCVSVGKWSNFSKLLFSLL